MLWAAGALTLTAAVYFTARKYGANWPDFSAFAQGFAAIVTVVALFIAAGIYFVERKDKPRIEFDVTAARALIPARGARPATVLLGIRILVKNNGNRQVELECMSLDMYLPNAGAPLVRNAGAPEEMALAQIRRPIPLPPRANQLCLRGEERRLGFPPGSVRPLYMWPMLTLEPNEADDGYFEVPVSCAYPFVRVLVKLRLRPGDALSWETKAIIPLREICEGRAQGMAESVTEGPSAPAKTSGGAAGPAPE